MGLFDSWVWIGKDLSKHDKDQSQELLLGLPQLKIQEALLLYSRGLVSFGRAAEIAGLAEKEMIWQARAAGTQPRWSKAMAEKEELV